MAKPQPYRADPAILALGERFFDPVEAAQFPKSRLRFANHRWAAKVGLGELDDAGWLCHFGKFEALADNLPAPLALRYHGHQFRSYNPDIGDGRGFLFAQLRDDRDRLLDLGTKGSGQTPYSRFGDGRLTLKGGVREVLATEMLEALGVNTSKSFALIETGEQLTRGDEPSPTRSAVLTRLSHSHVRIGTFQRLAFHEDAAGIARLVRYSLEHLFDETAVADDTANAVRLFDLVATATAGLAASYLAAGFVHGVLNSDNINITGESFDYGPWRFAPTWDEEFVAAYFDHNGLYAFGRQPEAIHWDLAQLGGCLALVAEGPALAEILAGWSKRFEGQLVAAGPRLGLEPDETADRPLPALLAAFARRRDDRPIFFDWRGGGCRMVTIIDGAFAGLKQHFRADPCPTHSPMNIGRSRHARCISTRSRNWAAIAASDAGTVRGNIAAIRRWESAPRCRRRKSRGMSAEGTRTKCRMTPPCA